MRAPERANRAMTCSKQRIEKASARNPIYYAAETVTKAGMCKQFHPHKKQRGPLDARGKGEGERGGWPQGYRRRTTLEPVAELLPLADRRAARFDLYTSRIQFLCCLVRL